jgi:hypothetical protein
LKKCVASNDLPRGPSCGKHTGRYGPHRGADAGVNWINCPGKSNLSGLTSPGNCDCGLPSTVRSGSA